MSRFSGRQTLSEGAHTDQAGQFNDNRKGSIKDEHTYTKGVMRAYKEQKRLQAQFRQNLADAIKVLPEEKFLSLPVCNLHSTRHYTGTVH